MYVIYNKHLHICNVCNTCACNQILFSSCRTPVRYSTDIQHVQYLCIRERTHAYEHVPQCAAAHLCVCVVVRACVRVRVCMCTHIVHTPYKRDSIPNTSQKTSSCYITKKLFRVYACTHHKKLFRVYACTHRQKLFRVYACTHHKKLFRVYACTHHKKLFRVYASCANTRPRRS
jgi:hypothetical protein